jgi:Ca2+-binding RTX toxin-like protein
VIRRPRSQAGKAKEARDRRAGRLLAGLGSLVLLAAALPAAGEGAPSPDVADPVAVVSERVQQRPAEIREYWTPRRMRNAEPIELRQPSSLRSRSDAASVEPRGEPKLVLPASPGIPDTRAGILDGLLGGGADPQTRDAVDTGPNNTGFPQRVHGKVFFTISSGSDPGNFLCSGTAVRSPSHTLVWTAGHCVNDAEFNGGFATNFEFVPGYRNGQRPFGEWVAQRLFTTTGWQNNVNIRFDLGAAVLARDGDGRGIQDVIGARGIAFNQSRNQNFVAFGYPAVSTVFRTFNGQLLYTCASPRIGNDNPTGGTGPQPMEIDCDMTGGSSGGGWVINGQFVNSVTSYAYEFDFNSLFGPYLGTTAQNLYQQARGKKTKCAGEEVTNLGGSGADDFDGTAGADSFKLRRGRDSGDGGAGRDLLCGGKGKDLLIGGPGVDVCNGGKGRDRARGCEQRKKIP